MSPPPVSKSSSPPKMAPTHMDQRCRSAPNLIAITRLVLSKYDVQVVIVDNSERGSAPVVALFREALGPPKLSVEKFSLWVGWPGPRGTGRQPGR